MTDKEQAEQARFEAVILSYCAEEKPYFKNLEDAEIFALGFGYRFGKDHAARAPSAQEPVAFTSQQQIEWFRAHQAKGLLYWASVCSEQNPGLPVALYAAPVLSAVPEGWKLVPVEPDKTMAEAGRKAVCKVADRMETAKQTASSIQDFWQQVGYRPANEVYAAYVAAAPTPPQAQDAKSSPLTDSIEANHVADALELLIHAVGGSEEEILAAVEVGRGALKRFDAALQETQQ